MRTCIEAKAYRDGRLIPSTIMVEDGVVKESSMGYRCPGGVRRLAFTRRGLILVPGLLDIHVHLRGLGLSYKEDEYTGTAAAAAGGYTGVADMPNTYPKIGSWSALESKAEALESKALVNYGVYVGVAPGREARRMLGHPVVLGAKIYPSDLYDMERVEEAVRAAGIHGKPVVVHCEHPYAIREGCPAGRRWVCRGLEAEKLCMEEISRLPLKDTHVHVTHATSPELVYMARSRGFTVDTCPHYFLLSSEDEERLGCLGKVNPPLRPRSMAERLLEMVLRGVVDAVVSDHAPHTLAEKKLGFDECPAGMVGLEAYSRIMLDLVLRGLMGLGLFTRLMALGPARILGLRRYGCFEEGCLASYTVLDTLGEGVIRPEEFYSKARYSAFEGYRHRGGIAATIVNGLPVYVEGEIIPENKASIPLGDASCPLKQRLWVSGLRTH